MYYVKIVNNNPEWYNLTQLRLDNPTTSFPKNISAEDLAAFNVYEVNVSQPPAVNNWTEDLQLSTPTKNGNKWVASWNVIRKPELQVAFGIREARNEKLKECDWTQIADCTADKTAWANYRQALRDITSQPGFPYNVTWPTEPE